jgi:hypothetical protein
MPKITMQTSGTLPVSRPGLTGAGATQMWSGLLSAL